MRKTLSFVVLSMAVLAGCNRNAPTDATPAAAATVAPPATVVAPAAPATTATYGVATDAAPGEHTTFDAKAFAGEFANGHASITFTSDGSFTLIEESVDAEPPIEGTWTLESDGRHLRLDPHSKAESDRVYELVSNDELRADDGEDVMRRNAANH